ncbi:MAG: tyrosine-type recombinase/integrase [Thaumarchaeota archaeon]|nr:tyrosine-type recombinase/integrase [Nitrososphaerota archaeon]
MTFNNEGVAGPNKLKKLNNDTSTSFADEVCPKGLSDMGNNTTQTPKTTTPVENIEKLREKIWRKSHSQRSVKTFDDAIKSFEKFLAAKNMKYDQCMENPIDILDSYASWLDVDHSAGTTRTYVHYAKKTLKFMGARIDGEDFREKVTLPKKRPFQDDKVTKEQIRRIILDLNHLGLKTLLMLMKDTQARPAELLGLHMSDFNLSYDPPYLNIPAERAKNDMPRELFFTSETKELLVSYLKKEKSRPDDFLYLDGVDPVDEVGFQKRLMAVQSVMMSVFRRTLSGAQFADMNQKIQQRGSMSRYKIHIYSFKKFAFTVMADTLGEIAARAVKGDREYVLTYYRKSREERAEDFRKVIPKLSVFGGEEGSKIREQVEAKVKALTEDELAKLQEFLKTANA